MMKKYVPVERGAPPSVKSMPVKWFLLIREMEEFREQTGMGLARTWGYVHAEDYENARKSFENTVAMKRWGGNAMEYTQWEEVQ